MIAGSFSLSSNKTTSSVIDHLRTITDYDGLVFNPVVHGGFSGGFFLNKRLPYTSKDFCYCDLSADTVVLFSGVVYNKPELLKQHNLSASVSDPEMIAEKFLNEGPAFVKKLNGDFTIFIGHPGKKQAYLFRDHVGIRPMAFTTEGETLFFSSDIAGLCRALSYGKPINPLFLLGYFKYIDYRTTPVEGIKKLLPGHYIYFSEEGVETVKYWEPEKIKIDKNLTHDRMLSDLKAIVWDAVKIRCDSRFIAGAHVSSGIDSGIVSTLAREEYTQQHDFYGFSWSPDDYFPQNVKFDEREIVRSSCEKTNINPLFSKMNATDFKKIVSGFYYNQGYFYEDKTEDQAAEVNTNLIFSGWGGDEFISTGDRGIETDLLLGLKWGLFLRRNPLNRPRQFVKTLFYYILFPMLEKLDRGTARSFRNDARYLKKPFKRSDRKALRDYYFHTSRHQLHLRLLHFYHLQERCESWAINGYRKGVEYRYPLLDRRIIEYMLRVPSQLLCQTDYFRPILREISEGILPEEVRLHWQKNDPVWWAYMAELFEAAAGSFMEEVKEWKQNPDLHFVDFDLLANDIREYKKNPETVDTSVLFRALVYIKAINDFTVDFRRV